MNAQNYQYVSVTGLIVLVITIAYVMKNIIVNVMGLIVILIPPVLVILYISQVLLTNVLQ